MNSEIYVISIKKMKITYPKQQAFVQGAKYRAQNARHKQRDEGVQSIGVPFLSTNSLTIVSKLSTN